VAARPPLGCCPPDRAAAEFIQSGSSGHNPPAAIYGATVVSLPYQASIPRFFEFKGLFEVNLN